ncbi:MAG: NADH-quinone oxidoreductase subunit H, partial [Chloroflexota bacterium]
MIVISAIMSTLFFGGYLGPGVDKFPWLGPLYMAIKIIVSLFLMIWVRASWPRIRYNRLMAFGWKVMLPLALALVFITATGILLADAMGNPWLLAVIPVLSLVAGWVATLMVDRSLRRKAYA